MRPTLRLRSDYVAVTSCRLIVVTSMLCAIPAVADERLVCVRAGAVM
jgi:hypothetical protein